MNVLIVVLIVFVLGIAGLILKYYKKDKND